MNQTEQGESRRVGVLDTRDQFKLEHKRREKTAWMRSFMFVVFLGTLLSCSKPPPVQNATNDPQSAATYISQADQFYSQREDLPRLQQGIVLLRQAITAAPSNYDAAWRLSKCNYYLGTHVEGTQSEQAFRPGIEPAKPAGQSQGEKPEGHFWLGVTYEGSL